MFFPFLYHFYFEGWESVGVNSITEDVDGDDESDVLSTSSSSSSDFGDPPSPLQPPEIVEYDDLGDDDLDFGDAEYVSGLLNTVFLRSFCMWLGNWCCEVEMGVGTYVCRQHDRVKQGGSHNSY